MKDAGFMEWIIFLTEKYWKLLLEGTLVTLEIAFLGTLAGYLIGFLMGFVKKTQINTEDGTVKKILIRAVKLITSVYVEVFRDTPIIVQAMVIYYGLIGAGYKVSPFAAAVLTVGLNTGAYMAETVRAGIMSIDKGQQEGAVAIGMSNAQTMFYIILPQALKNILPEMSNQFLMNLKATSVLNVIGIAELYMCAKTASGVYYKYFESYIIVAVIYFILCFFANKLIGLMERKLKGKDNYVLETQYMNLDEE